ncbi:biliverdin-producing heme oxygenase [Alteromonas sp. ASW11-19]|uniref:Biliverdin-producing heme oxygenase n=1 Tax=Alteromonas salexigens TaxID=2982530 RepID=A0ABT2VKT0_9ALTE|nr:biliverdin-producing heme oxygenase [Alteromonas salexigens]MCU7553906.1 biliverdin-producing heme oxygenase [Alteromonas salexigens]
MTIILDRLRQATAAEHTALENTPPFNALMSATFSGQQYGQVLTVLHGFHREIASAMEGLHAHPVVHMLHCDTILQALERDRTTITGPQASPFNFPLSLSACRADVLACGYVWLGSSMGGKMIARWLSQQHPHQPTAYYASLAACSKNWAEFRRYTSGIQLNESETQRCCLVAKTLFEELRSAANKLTEHLTEAS